ncbi:hypothetical protein JCM3765_002248 [Sporobolomyces pararoseus]
MDPTKPAVSPRPLTFALPPSETLRQSSSSSTATNQHSTPGIAAPNSNNFLNRLSRRISQSGANLKRKVSGKGGTGSSSGGRGKPVRRASEADKENRSAATPQIVVAESNEVRKDEGLAQEKPRKATLKRGLRVSVMRRSKSEGAPQEQEERSSARRGKKEEEVERIEELGGEQVQKNEDQSEVSSHRGSYFYSNSLGVCWDGRERVHPDAFAFKPYSSNCDVLPSPVMTDSRVVYASTLSSFPPRPPLRPRTPPQLTPASQIAAEYRALHPKTPSVYSFSDFDTPPVDPDCPAAEEAEITPTNASPSPSSPPSPRPAPPTLEPINTSTKGYTSSTHSSIPSSRPSATFCEPLTPGLSEDSSTSLESLARDNMLSGSEHELEADEEQGGGVRGDERAKELSRFSLVDSGPVSSPLHPKPSMVFSEGSSTIDTWRECE